MLRGQITAVYKKEKQLGTLDAGVQRLIEGIIGDTPGIFRTLNPFPNKASESAYLSAVDNFLRDEGAVDLSGIDQLRKELGEGRGSRCRSRHTSHRRHPRR